MRTLFTSRRITVCLLALTVAVAAQAAVFRVGPGQSLQAAANRLKPGDTLLVEPGVYRQTVKLGKMIATAAKPITIRARVPGSVFLIGSVTVTGWRKTPNTRGVYFAPLPKPTTLVYERDTNREFIEMADIYRVDDTAASFMYDADNKRIYVHTSDGAAPAKHLVDACVLTRGFDFWSGGPANWWISLRKHIVIDGFTLQGYAKCGVHFMRADSCEVRNCVADHCGAGVFMHSSIRSAIRNCRASWCYDRNDNEGGGIAFRGRNYDDIVQGCVVHDCVKYGIRHYGGGFQGCVIENCLTYRIGRCALHTKGSPDAKRRHAQMFKPPASKQVMRVTHNVTVEKARPFTMLFDCWGGRYNTIGGKSASHRPGMGEDLKTELIFKPGNAPRVKFVDPVNRDYRLQSDSPYAGKNVGAFPYKGDVFFVKPNGDDRASGTCVAKAWRDASVAVERLNPGQTLYVLPGTYCLRASLAVPAKGEVSIRGHGKAGAVFEGAGAPSAITVSGGGRLDLRRLRFTGFTGPAVVAKGAGLSVERCVFADNGAGVAAGGATRIVKSVFYRNRGAAVQPGAVCQVYGCAFLDNATAYASAGGVLSEFNALPGPVAPGLATLPAWRGKTGQDTESLADAPRFRSPAAGDFRLAADSPGRGRGYLWSPVGLEPPPHYWYSRPTTPRIKDVRATVVTPTMANLFWRSEGGKTAALVRYGLSPKKMDKVVLRDIGVRFRNVHAVTLFDLKPGTTYHYEVGRAPYRNLLSQAPRDPKTWRWDPEVRRFTTPTTYTPKRRTLYVSKRRGDDANDGLSPERPFASVHKASRVALPGDRVIVGAGEYFGLLRPINSGVPAAPIVFEAAKGETVVLSGKRLVQSISALLLDKAHITLRGFHFKEHCKMLQDDVGGGAQLTICDSRNIRVEDGLFDGRMYYMCSARVYRSRDIDFSNNVFVIRSNWTGIVLRHNTGRVTFDHNTLYMGATSLGYIVSNADVVFTNNVFGEKTRNKWSQPKFNVFYNKKLVFDHNYWAFDPKNTTQYCLRLCRKPQTPYVASARLDPRNAKRPSEDPLARARAWVLSKHGVVGGLPWAHADRVTKKSHRIRGVPNRDQNYGALELSDFELKPKGPWKGIASDGGDPGRRSR